MTKNTGTTSGGREGARRTARGRAVCLHVAILAALGLFAATGAEAVPCLALSGCLKDLDSRVTIVPTDNGITSWVVKGTGTNQLEREWFWYRVGSNPEAPISDLSLDATESSAPNQVKYTFSDDTLGAAFTLVINLVLDSDPDPSVPDQLLETVTVTADAGNEGALNLNLFEYTDFDLNGDAAGDSGRFLNDFQVTQEDDDSPAVNARTIAGDPDEHQIVADAIDLLNLLNDGDADDLNGASGPLSGDDIAWAFQWDLQLPPGLEVSFTKQKFLTPEPGSLALAALGLLGLAAWRKPRPQR